MISKESSELIDKILVLSDKILSYALPLRLLFRRFEYYIYLIYHTKYIPHNHEYRIDIDNSQEIIIEIYYRDKILQHNPHGNIKRYCIQKNVTSEYEFLVTKKEYTEKFKELPRGKCKCVVFSVLALCYIILLICFVLISIAIICYGPSLIKNLYDFVKQCIKY